MSGWLLLRLAGIVVGIATLLRLATQEGLVTYDPLFQAWMDELRSLLEIGVILDFVIQPVVHWLLDAARSIGFQVPTLHELWRPTFVLSWLMLGTISRHRPSLLMLIAATILSVVFAVLCGLLGTMMPAVFLFAFAPIFSVPSGGEDNAFQDPVVIALPLAPFVAFLCLGLTGLALRSVVPNADASLKFAIAATVPIAAGATLLLLFAAALSWRRGWRAVISHVSFNVGIDILGVMLGALFIASLAASPPIW